MRVAHCTLVGRLIMLRSKDFVFLECCFSIFALALPSFSFNVISFAFPSCVGFEPHIEQFPVASSSSCSYEVAIEVAVVENVASQVE
jgi:hypothetical protein